MAAQTKFAQVYTTISGKMAEAKNAVTRFLSDAISSISSSPIVEAARTKFQSVYEAISGKFNDAKNAAIEAIQKIKDKIDNTNMSKDVHINVYENTYESTYRNNSPNRNSWNSAYASAYTDAVRFTRPTVLPTINGNLRFGDRGGAELVIGESKLMQMIRSASGGGTTINMTVNGAGMNPNEVANLAAEKITARIMRNNQRW
jgi:hypothetical protein